MINFNEYFKDQYQFFLTEIKYDLIPSSGESVSVQFKIQDNLATAVVGSQLQVEFCREVFFDPEALYHLTVKFGLALEFREGVNPAQDELNWANELAEGENPYMHNVLCRTSNLIAQITASYGQQPLITPPSIVR